PTQYSIFTLSAQRRTNWNHHLSPHDALPISSRTRRKRRNVCNGKRRKRNWRSRRNKRRRKSNAKTRNAGKRRQPRRSCATNANRDRKSTRLNSSHVSISYAVFCVKTKNSEDG